MPPSSREYLHHHRHSSSHPHSQNSYHHRSSGLTNPMNISYLLNPSHTPSTSPHHTPSSSPRLSPSPPLSPAQKVLLHKRKIQSEKKRQWRKNLTPEQKERRQQLDAARKREQRLNQTDEQRAEARRKDAARKAAKRRCDKQRKLRAQEAAHEQQQRRYESSTRSPRGGSFRHTSGDASKLHHSIDKILNGARK